MKRPEKYFLTRLRKFFWGFLILLISTAYAEESLNIFDKEAFIESANTNKVLRISLVDCITFALKNNSDIKIKRIEPKIKEDDIRIARSDFEPTLTANWTLRDNTKPSTSTLAGANILQTRDIDFNASLSGKLITGTEVLIELINERYKSNSSFQSINPYYTAEPKLTLTQPLLRDSGISVNTAEIRIAQNERLVSEEDFKETVMEIITRTKADYYDYIYYLEKYAIASSALRRAEDLLEINKARYQKGLVSSVDLLETESAVAQRQKALLSAEAELKKSEDELKLITNLVDDPQVWNTKIELIDKEIEFNVEKGDLIESLKNAFKYRPDYNSQMIDLKNRDIKILTAKNALFPTMDLVGSFGLNGLGKDYQDSIDNISSDYKDWSVGVKLSIPWGGEERTTYDQKKLEKAQVLIELKKLEQEIILEVRDKFRAVDIQMRQVEAAKISKEKETQNYEAQKERYAQGQVSTHEILEYQENLAQAELDYIKSLIDYNIAIINLEKSEGLTLVKNNIILEE